MEGGRRYDRYRSRTPGANGVLQSRPPRQPQRDLERESRRLARYSSLVRWHHAASLTEQSMPDEIVPTSSAHIVQEAADFQWDGNKLEPGIGIALSGGGFRAMLFHAGALLRLNEL